MAVVELKIVPLGTGNTSLSLYVAACHEELSKYGEDLSYQLTAMGTIIQGDLDKILDVARRMHEIPFKKGAVRVSTTITIDDRRDKEGSIRQKTGSVEEKMRR